MAIRQTKNKKRIIFAKGLQVILYIWVRISFFNTPKSLSMKAYYFFVAVMVIVFLGSCNKRSTCAAYQEVGAFGIPDENYEPSNYIIVQRNKKTGRVKKVGKVRKVQYTSRAEKSKLFKKEKKFIKDGELFPDEKKNKKAKSAKKSKKTQEEEENSTDN